MDRLACPDSTPPESRYSNNYQLRVADLNDVTIEYLGSFTCEVAAGLAFSRTVNKFTGEEGDPCKVQILEDGRVIEERCIA